MLYRCCTVHLCVRVCVRARVCTGALMTEEPRRPLTMFNELKIKPAEGQVEVYMCNIYETLGTAICLQCREGATEASQTN